MLGLLGGLVALWTGGTAALLAVSETPPRSAAPSSSSLSTARVTAPAPVTLTPFPRSLAELRAVNADATRLRPDARFVAAFADVQRLRGRPNPVATATFTNDHWVVSVDGRPAGELPPLATPADALTALARFVHASPATAPDAAAPLHVADITPGTELAALRALAAPVTAAGPAHPAAAARLLAMMLFGTRDDVDGTDPVAARALAAAAWARAVGSPAPDAEAIIATQMGYPAAARALAAGLSEGDPVRAFVDHDYDNIVSPTEEPGAAYLYFRRSIENRELGMDGAFAAMSPPVRASLSVVAWLPRAVPVSDFAASLSARRAAPAQVVSALRRETGAAPSDARLDDAQVLSMMGELLARPNEPAPWLDGGVTTARTNAAVWSALQQSLDVDLVVRSDPGAAREQLQAMERGASTSTRPMIAWFTALVAAEGGERRSLVECALSPDVLPGALRLRAVEETGAMFRRPTLLHVAPRLDARPTHRAGLLELVAGERLDPIWHRSLCQAAVTDARDTTDATAECRRRDARVPGSPPPSPESLAEIEARFVARDTQTRSWMGGRAEHARWLIAQHRAAEAVTLAQAWLAAHPEGLEPAVTRAGLARAQLALGDVDAAWASIEPALASWQGTAMAAGVEVLMARGRLDEALTLATQRLTRYPGIEQATTVAEVLWRQNDVANAANALAPQTARTDQSRWRDVVGAAVSRVYLSQDPSALGAATAAMVQARLPVGVVETLALDLLRDGHPAHALAAHEALRAPGLRGLALFAVRYRLMAAARSRDEADRWLAATVPPAARGPVAMFAFGDDDDALLWTAADSATADADGTAYLWLLRAGATLRSAPDPARRARVEAAVASPTEPYHHMARYLLGLESMEQMLSLATADDRRAEVAFWIAFRAHCEGRLEEAAEWYRFLVRRGPESEGEVGWALRPLRHWSDAPGWLDAVVDPWAQAHAGVAAPVTAPVAAPVAEEPASTHGHRRGRHRAPGGHHRHRRHHPAVAPGARS